MVFLPNWLGDNTTQQKANLKCEIIYFLNCISSTFKMSIKTCVKMVILCTNFFVKKKILSGLAVDCSSIKNIEIM